MQNNSYINSLIYWITQKRWLIIVTAISSILYLFPTPEGLTQSGYRIIIVALIALTLIVSETLPLPGTAFVIIVLEVFFGIGDANSVSRSFMNDAVFFIMGSLMLAVAIVRQGWDERIALGIIRFTGNKTTWITFGFAFVSAILSSFIGEHTVVAIMLPIALTLIRFTSKAGKNVKHLSANILFSIAYGSLIGSIGTPSGGGRNVILLNYWREFGMSDISYIRWMVYTYPLILIQIPILSWLLNKIFPPEFKVLDSSIRRLKRQVAISEPLSVQKIGSLGIFFMIFLGWVFLSDTVGLGIIALSGVILYLITGIVTWDDLSKHVNWGVIILFGATISLGYQINHTGAAEWIVNRLISLGENLLLSFPILTDGVVALLTTIFANVLSSSATVAVLGPITLNLPGDTTHLGLITAIASSFGYLTAVAAPACTIIYTTGIVRSKDFLKVGMKMGIISILLLVIYANIYWPLLQ